MRISERTKKVMNEAKEKVRKEASNPKKRKIVKGDSIEQTKNPPSKWLIDEWDDQGEIFFDGYRYWGVFLEPSNELGILNTVSKYWSIEKWEEWKNPALNLEITETEEPLSSIPKITKSIKPSERVPKGKSPTRSGKTVIPVKQVKWG